MMIITVVEVVNLALMLTEQRFIEIRIRIDQDHLTCSLLSHLQLSGRSQKI
jgi:hypothetical protein